MKWVLVMELVKKMIVLVVVGIVRCGRTESF